MIRHQLARERLKRRNAVKQAKLAVKNTKLITTQSWYDISACTIYFQMCNNQRLNCLWRGVHKIFQGGDA